MPSANHIRKEILQALENHILPALWHSNISMGCVIPPLDFPDKIHARLLQKSIPRRDISNIAFPLKDRWAKAKLQASHYPYFGFLYEGAADERTLITREQANKYHLSEGIYAIRWQAPSVLLIPPGTPRNDGSASFWHDETPAPHRKILWLSGGSELFVRNGIKDAAGQRHGQHPLEINDPTTITLAELFIRELQNANITNQELARTILLSTMLSLQKFLYSHHVKIANTSFSPLPGFGALPDAHMCRDAAIYIERHLHKALTLPDIAAQVGFSPTHLNRLFQRHCGLTVMHYVRTHRIAAAKGLLEKGSENIEEISQLVGFKRANVFCRAFREVTGMTPRQYRRISRHTKSTLDGSG